VAASILFVTALLRSLPYPEPPAKTGTATVFTVAIMGVCTVALITGILASSFAVQMERRKAEFQAHVDEALRRNGIDPDRLSVFQLGHKSHIAAVPSWLWRLLLGLSLWIAAFFLDHLLARLSLYLQASVELVIGLIILVAACEILVAATERLAARFQWNHYTAGTLAEILSTTPELVVIAFIVPVSPAMAFIISVITIYNNALVFSLYSYFLPKDKHGKFLMPTPITEAGTQILIGGGAMGLILGLVMLTLNSAPESKSSFSATDLIFVSIILLTIFAVYLYKLVTSYAAEEAKSGKISQ